MKKLIFILVAICSIVLVSCGVSSDKSTERMLQGTWVSEEESDGFYFVDVLNFKKKEIKSKDITIRSFVETVRWYDLDDGELACTMTITGSWSANKVAIEYDYKIESLQFTYTNAFYKESFQTWERIVKAEFEKDPVYRAELVSVNSGEFIEKDEDGDYKVYRRPEKD